MITFFLPIPQNLLYSLFSLFNAIYFSFIRLTCVRHAASVHPEPGQHFHSIIQHTNSYSTASLNSITSYMYFNLTFLGTCFPTIYLQYHLLSFLTSYSYLSINDLFLCAYMIINFPHHKVCNHPFS